MSQNQKDTVLLPVIRPLLQRVQIKPGNGLSKCMNNALRSYPNVPLIIERSAHCLFQAEKLVNFSEVSLNSSVLYTELIEEHDDWGYNSLVYDLPIWLTDDQMDESDQHFAEGIHNARAILFRRHARLPFQRYHAAMTIAKRIGLLAGHGRIGFTQEIRKQLRHRISQLTNETNQYE